MGSYLIHLSDLIDLKGQRLTLKYEGGDIHRVRLLDHLEKGIPLPTSKEYTTQ